MDTSTPTQTAPVEAPLSAAVTYSVVEFRPDRDHWVHTSSDFEDKAEAEKVRERQLTIPSRKPNPDNFRIAKTTTTVEFA